MLFTTAIFTALGSWALGQILESNGIALRDLIKVVQDEEELSTQVGQLDEAVINLQTKHIGGFIVGIKYFYDCGCYKYRMADTNGDRKYYPAYRSKSSNRYGKWVYLKEGLEYLIYN